MSFKKVDSSRVGGSKREGTSQSEGCVQFLLSFGEVW